MAGFEGVCCLVFKKIQRCSSIPIAHQSIGNNGRRSNLLVDNSIGLHFGKLITNPSKCIVFLNSHSVA